MANQFADILADLSEYKLPASETIVLVIDDEPMILGTMQKVLARAGYVVLTAESAELGAPALAGEVATGPLKVPAIPSEPSLSGARSDVKE